MSPLAIAPLLAMLNHNQLWYSIPLLVAVSLVYGATRDEEMGPILTHAYRAGIWIASFLFTVFLVLWVTSWFV